MRGKFAIAFMSLIALVFSGCGIINAPEAIPISTIPTLQFITQSISQYEEIQSFEIDNCNGKADLKHIETRFRSMEVTISAEIAAKLGVNADVISAEIQTAFGISKSGTDGKSTSVEVAAPPKTRMYFEIAWIGDARVGVVQNVRGSNIPITFRDFTPTNFRIKNQRDLMCSTPQPATQNSIPTQETLTCQNVLKNAQIYSPGQMISGPAVLHPFEGCVEMANQLKVVCILRWGINIKAGQSLIIPQTTTLPGGKTIIPAGYVSKYENDMQVETVQNFWLTTCP